MVCGFEITSILGRHFRLGLSVSLLNIASGLHAQDLSIVNEDVQAALESGQDLRAKQILSDFISDNEGTPQGNQACNMLEQVEGRPGPSSNYVDRWIQGYVTLPSCERRYGFIREKVKRGNVTIEFRTEHKLFAKKWKYPADSLVTFGEYQKSRSDMNQEGWHPGFITTPNRRIEGHIRVAGQIWESHWNSEYPGTKIVNEYDAPRFQNVWIEPEPGGQVFLFTVSNDDPEWRVTSATQTVDGRFEEYIVDGGETCTAEKYCRRHMILKRTPEEEAEAVRNFLADEKYRVLWDTAYAADVLARHNDRERRRINTGPGRAYRSETAGSSTAASNRSSSSGEEWVMLANGVGQNRRCFAVGSGSVSLAGNCVRQGEMLFKSEFDGGSMRLRNQSLDTCLSVSSHPSTAVFMAACNDSALQQWTVANSGQSGRSIVYRFNSVRAGGGCLTLDESSGTLTLANGQCQRNGATLITVIRPGEM